MNINIDSNDYLAALTGIVEARLTFEFVPNDNPHDRHSRVSVVLWKYNGDIDYVHPMIGFDEVNVGFTPYVTLELEDLSLDADAIIMAIERYVTENTEKVGHHLFETSL